MPLGASHPHHLASPFNFNLKRGTTTAGTAGFDSESESASSASSSGAHLQPGSKQPLAHIQVGDFKLDMPGPGRVLAPNSMQPWDIMATSVSLNLNPAPSESSHWQAASGNHDAVAHTGGGGVASAATASEDL